MSPAKPADRSNVRVNGDRLWQSLAELARVNPLPHGGCCRTALSPADEQGRNLFIAWCTAAGCAIVFDRVGNIFATRPGQSPDLPAVATGSHLDTQPHGGRFDGAYGVMAGLEVIRTLNDAHVRTRAPVTVAVWTNEEGARFRPALAGSAAFIGKFSAEEVLSSLTTDGTTVEDDLKRMAHLGTLEPGAQVFESFLEAHIEQGPVLEDHAIGIGVVTQVQAIRFYEIEVRGEDGHAGTMPLDRRKDALLGASKMIVEMNARLAGYESQPKFTVGRLTVEPNSPNTIPGLAIFSIDSRHPQKEVLDRLERDIRATVDAIAAAAGLSASVRMTIDVPAVAFSPDVMGSIRAAIDGLGYPFLEIVSQAGHDAMNLAQRVPTGMIFVPCKGGISHNEAESATPAELEAGANVLLHAILERAGTV